MSHNLSLQLATRSLCLEASTLPRQTLHAAERAVLDGIGVMLAASGASSDVMPFREYALARGGKPEARILGFNDPVAADQAAFVNGAMAHALDYEDAFDAVPLHPNASLLPAALASAELHGCSGREFLAAVVLGCDLVCRLGLSLRQRMESYGWYPPPILGAFGAALAAARIARLTPRQLCDAWSMLLCQNSCAGEIKHSPDATLRAVREAFPAQAAVTCVQLAARGVRGFDAPFEGKAGFYRLFAGGDYDEQPLLAGIGEVFWIEQLSFKRWPTCRGTHAYIEAAQALRHAERLDPQRIESFLCIGGDIQQMLAEPKQSKRAPRTLIDAKFSLPFVVAMAFTHAEIDLESFSSRALSDAAVLDLAARSEFQRDPSWGAGHAAGGKLILRLRSGETLEHEVARAFGEPTRPISDALLRAKFVDCAAHAAVPLTRERAHCLAERLLNLDSEAAVTNLLRQL